MTVTGYNRDSRYAGFCTSGEILKAIEELAGDDTDTLYWGGNVAFKR